MYDLVVIGGGPAGYAGAIRASKLGLKTALIEKEHLGGTCLNRGCIPTKALLHSAQIYSEKNQFNELGIEIDNISFNQEKVYLRKNKIVETLRNGINTLIKANKIDLFNGHGYIQNKNLVKVNEQELPCKHILIATGSSPKGYDKNRSLNGIEEVLNSDDVLNTPILGKDVIIIGGGVIAIEFASYLSSIDKNVTLLITGERILKSMSKDLSMQLGMVLKRKGVKIIASAQIERLYKDGVLLKDGQRLNADAVIAAVGRSSNLTDIGLENIGIKPDKFIKVDENMQTEVEGVYAAGDIIGSMQLAHYATASAITAVESILSLPHSINLSVCPSCIYTQPEIAVVGVNEGEKTGKFIMGGNGKSMIEGQNRGYIKVIADSDDTIIGAEAFCLRATDLIGELALAVEKKMKVSEVLKLIHPHPTVMEAVQESLEDIHNLAIHILPRN